MSTTRYSILTVLFSLFLLSGIYAVNPREKMWLPEINAFMKQDSVDFPAKNQILFVGSSSIRGWKNLPSYFEEYQVIQRGVGGTHLEDIIYFADKIVFPYLPSQIVLYEGDNDLKDGFSPEMYVDDVRTFVRLVQIKQPGTPILILSIKPSPARDYLKQKYLDTNALLKSYCESNKLLSYVDITSSVLDSDGEYISESFLSDNLHLTKTAYEKWAEIIKSHLIQNK